MFTVDKVIGSIIKQVGLIVTSRFYVLTIR